eukprot:TRINITY_DN75238_c0_g1_i1.p1 TRINITY_DN75238_c0_g1~~TRINITY_DN75238_c0_g1_i1.p1  ORF type:complete len:638 (+),score=65.53 TRINITY_DN75238_c0_g1_i1:100-2013(+)
MAGLSGIAPETYGCWLIIGINAFCLVLYMIVVLYGALATLHWSALRSQVLGKVEIWVQNLRQYMTSRLADDAFSLKVRQLVAEARLTRCKGLCRISIHVLACFSIYTILIFGYYDFTTFEDVSRARWEIHQSSFVHLTLGFLMSMYGWLWPSYTTLLTFDFFHFLVLARLSWQACTSETVYHIFALDTVSLGMRFLGAMVVGTPTLTFGLNLVYSVLKVWTYHSLFHRMEAVEQDFVAEVWGSIFLLAVHEMFLCAAAWWASTIVETWNFATVRATLQAKTSSTSVETVNSLLAVLCDAVVTIDRGLIFRTPSSQIAHFLVRYPPNNSYVGVSFLDFVEEQDRDRIYQQITGSSTGHGTTLSLTTRLIDGNGSALNVQMYCTCFIDIDDSRAYSIGILEAKDMMMSQIRPDTLSHDMDIDGVANGHRGSGALNYTSETDGTSFQSLETDTESMAVPLALSMSNTQVELWIDIADPEIPVLSTSVLMTHIAGPSPCGSFVKWLPCSSVDKFIAKISAAFKAFVSSPVTSPVEVDLGSIKLRPAHARRAGLEYKANAILDLSSIQEHGVDGDKVPVCLRFYDICIKKIRRSSASGRATPRQDRDGRLMDVASGEAHDVSVQADGAGDGSDAACAGHMSL